MPYGHVGTSRAMRALPAWLLATTRPATSARDRTRVPGTMLPPRCREAARAVSPTGCAPATTTGKPHCPSIPAISSGSCGIAGRSATPETSAPNCSALGVDESCLGRYGLPTRALVPGMRVTGASPGIIADAKRLQAILKLPRDLNGKLYVMCVQAISEGDGDLPGIRSCCSGSTPTTSTGWRTVPGSTRSTSTGSTSSGSGPMRPSFTRGATPNPTVVLTAAGAEMSNMHVRGTECAAAGWKNSTQGGRIPPLPGGKIPLTLRARGVRVWKGIALLWTGSEAAALPQRGKCGA